ncbi:MAG TPA: hypothetical protein VH859_09705 [Candidatus Limnocylindria bacterium]
MPDRLTDDLVEMLTLMREAERDVFGALDPAVRDRPIQEGDWSPKDHQAHLSAWKGRQADRLAAARSGTQLEPWEDEDDVVNARLQARTADWDWDAVVADADAAHERLIGEVRAADPDQIRSGDHLLDGTYGNGMFHAQQHFLWLQAADIGIDHARVTAFNEDAERIVRRAGLGDRDRGTALYNLACFQALAGRLDRARPLLREAFGLRGDLVEFAPEDPDLEALREEIGALAAQ